MKGRTRVLLGASNKAQLTSSSELPLFIANYYIPTTDNNYPTWDYYDYELVSVCIDEIDRSALRGPFEL
jgi:hypothetical protein